MSNLKVKNVVKKTTILLSVFSFLAILASCAETPVRYPLFSYIDPRMKEKPIPVKVGIKTFKDVRDSNEKDKMSKLGNIELDVTKFFEYSKVFSGVEWEYNPKDVDVILNGRIKNFQWESIDYSLIFAFTLPLWVLFGGPIGHVSAHAGIELSLENAQRGEIIATYFEEQKFHKGFSKWTYPYSKGHELRNITWELAERIQGRILADRDKILKSLNRSD